MRATQLREMEVARATDSASAQGPQPWHERTGRTSRSVALLGGALLWILAAGGLLAPTAKACGTRSKPIRDAIAAADGACLTADALAVGLAHQGHAKVDERITVRVRESEDAFEYRLSEDAPYEHKEVGGEACSVKVFVASVAIALALDQVTLPPDPACEPPASVPMSTKRGPGTAPPRERGATSLEVVSLIGVLPAITLGVAPRSSVAVDPFVDLSVSGLVSLPVVSPLGPGQIESGLVAGRFDLCLKEALPAGLLRGCLGVAGGAVPASGQGFDAPSSWVGPWAAVISRFDARWTLTHRYGIAASVEVIVPVVRPQFDVTDLGHVSLSPVGVGLGLGPWIAF